MNSKQIVYLSQSQYAELIANGSITVNGVTVTYDENDIYVTPQAEPVTDVRVNGSSVAANGVADIPIAGTTYGVIKSASDTGISVNNGTVRINGATDYQIKEGSKLYMPIVVSKQHQATFYGLAKAAGHDEASSTESVGTYTPEAKGAIQQMLGVSDLIATSENNLTASKAYAIGDVFTANGKLYKATAAIAADAAIITDGAGANCEETSIGEGFVKFTDLATNGTPGIVKVWNTYGVDMIGAGNLRIFGASESDTKTGTQAYHPITPAGQHNSVFYGLAKAAGDTTQSQSTNPVGAYTDDAKDKIKDMLGIYDGVPYYYVEKSRPVDNSFLELYDAANAPFSLTAVLPRRENNPYTKIYINCEDWAGDKTDTCEIDITDPMDELTITLGTDGIVTVIPPIAGDAYTVPGRKMFTYNTGCAISCTDENYESITNWTINYALDPKGYTDYKFGDIVAPVEIYSYVLHGPYAVGDMFIKDGKLYKVTAAIAEFGNIVVGTNCEESTVSAATVHDVQVNGTSVVTDGVANVPIMSSNIPGVAKLDPSLGTTISSGGAIIINAGTDTQIKDGINGYRPVVPLRQHQSVFYGLAKASGDTTQSASSNAVGVYTDNAKASIKSMLGIVDGSTGTVNITGATPTINAVENTRYVCGEVTSLSFTPPSSGISIVRFTSGSTVTVLTIPSTVKFPEWFDPTTLETNTIYEICVTDGTFGAVMSWAL